MRFPSSIKKIVVTGGSGFIGGTLVRKLLIETDLQVINIDKLGYASSEIGNQNFIAKHNINQARYKFLKIDLRQLNLIEEAICEIKPDLIFHLAAESHVDRSIKGPVNFLESNVIGTFNLLQSSLKYYERLKNIKKTNFKFIHVSTDEVYGSLGKNGVFSEASSYAPRSPYSASKAASDHFVNAWHHTYGLPVIVTNCGNNYGPWQFPEKLVPLAIINALTNSKIEIYGDGKNIRDWIFVDDHVDGLITIAICGKLGHSYCIGGNEQKTNNDLILLLCKNLDELNPINRPHKRLITFVKDRKGHDRRYAIDNTKIKNELCWTPKYNLEIGLKKTVKWYLDNLTRIRNIMKNKLL